VHATPNYAQIRFLSGRESTVPLRVIAPVEEFETASLEQNEANAEVGNEAAQPVHSPVDVVPGHGEHAENTVSDPALPQSTNHCDDRTVLQDGGNRAEEILHADAEKSPAPIVRRSTRPQKTADRYGVVPY